MILSVRFHHNAPLTLVAAMKVPHMRCERLCIRKYLYTVGKTTRSGSTRRNVALYMSDNTLPHEELGIQDVWEQVKVSPVEVERPIIS